MARKSSKKRNPRFHADSVGDYRTGYGKPPADTRFKSGSSGNLNGRPKGKKNKPLPIEDLHTIIDEEGSRLLEHKEGNLIKQKPTARFIVRKINHNAANGNVRSQKLALDLMMMAQAGRHAKRDKLFNAAYEYKKWWRDDSAQRKREGVPDPYIYPHPDDLLLNFETGEVTIAALTADEVTRMRLLIEAKKFYETSVLDLLDEDIGSADAAIIWRDLRFCVDMLRIIYSGLDLEWADDFRKAPDFGSMRALAQKMKKDVPPKDR